MGSKTGGTGSDAQIDALRRQIDDIDRQLHDLLMQRADVVRQVGIAKGNPPRGAAAIRPGREVTMLRDLLSRHDGPLPATAIVNFWRQFISAFTRIEGPILICLASEDPVLGGLARAHFGADGLYEVAEDNRAMLAACADKGALGVAPLADTSANPWWHELAQQDGEVCVFAGLPAVRSGLLPDAVALGTVRREPETDDAQLWCVAATADMPNGAQLIARHGDAALVCAPMGADLSGGTLLGGFARSLLEA